MAPSTASEFLPDRFFVLRTPLLPFDVFASWCPDGDGDRAKLRARLRELVGQPEVSDALFLASPSLHESIPLWLEAPESERGGKVERALVRYLERMATRPTPFGLFAGCAVGRLGEQTHLAIGPRSAYRRHTSLDMQYICALAETLAANPVLRAELRYRPNSSLYPAGGGRLRYVEWESDEERARSYRLVAIQRTSYLDATLARAAEGAGSRLAELATPLLADEGVSEEEARLYLTELVESQILMPDLEPAISGAEPLADLAARLASFDAGRPIAGALETIRAELASLDACGPGVEAGRYRRLAARLEELPAEVRLPRLFQCELVKPAPELTLSRELAQRVLRSAELLQRIGGPARPDPLQRFRRAFTDRFEGAEVPLCQVLDEESGIGLDDEGATGDAPALEDLAFPAVASETGPRPARREEVLFGLLDRALRDGALAVELGTGELRSLEDSRSSRRDLSDAFCVFVSIAGPLDDATLFVHSVSGPSGAALLGRFCHADDELRRAVVQHIAAEEALRPEAVFAEIIHLPEGRMGNILCRPLVRGHEIPYLGSSGAPAEQQIPVGDLHVSVRGGRVVLRSTRLDKEVLPRLTSAHNFAIADLALYRFLCLLQQQDSPAQSSWSWAPLDRAPFLPRVSAGRVVLSLARWRLGSRELAPFRQAAGADRFRLLQELRCRFRLPRLVALADFDNHLPIDLDNPLSVEAALQLLKERQEAILVEQFPPPEALCVTGPEGHFVGELVVPFLRQRPPRSDEGVDASAPRRATHHLPTVARSFAPGSDWHYAKLYCGAAVADEVLRQVVRPVVTRVLERGDADSWFFIRYADPEPHIRLRLHGAADHLQLAAAPALFEVAAPLRADGRLWRLQLDTYEREVERYGGGRGIILAERLFQADSEAALGFVEALDGDEARAARFPLTLVSLDRLMGDLGFDLEARLALVRRLRADFGREHGIDADFERQLAVKYRKERPGLEALLEHDGDGQNPLHAALEHLAARSAALAPVVAELRQADAAGELSSGLEGLATSYLHMTANRLLPASARAQELVLYDFLARLYESRLARARARRPR